MTVAAKQQSERKEANSVRAPRKPTASILLEWLPFLVCAVPSILLLLFVPPTFNNTDSSNMLCSNLGFLVPHWPPLYPLYLICIRWVFGISDAGLYATVIGQHIIAIASAVYLVATVTGTWRRFVIAVFASAANYFFVISHGIFTEALSTPLLLLYIAAASRLALHSKTELDTKTTNVRLELFWKPRPFTSPDLQITRRMTAFFICYASLYLMTLARHNMFIFAALLPSMYLIRTFLRVEGSNLKYFAACLGCSLVSFMSVHFTNELICKLTGSEATALYGRVTVYRLLYLPWDTMPSADKVHLLSNALRRCPDDFTRFAMLTMVTDKDPWIGTSKKLRAVQARFGGRKTADQAMNDAAKAFFMTPNKYLVTEILKAFDSYMGKGNCTFNSLIGCSAGSIIGYQPGLGHYDVSPSFRNIGMIQKIDPRQYQRIAAVINPGWFDSLCQYIPMAALAIGISVLGVVRGLSSRGALTFVLALCLCAFLYAAISGALTIFLSRYIVPVNVVGWLILAFSIVSWNSFKKDKVG